MVYWGSMKHLIEVWSAHPRYPGHYEVSSAGRVRSLSRVIKVTTRRTTYDRPIRGKILSPSIGTNGRPFVGMQVAGDVEVVYLHVAVCETFKGPRPPGYIVRHLDGDKLNNSVDNLVWGTYAENRADYRVHGTDANLNKTHCVRGHEYIPENTLPQSADPRRRQCRSCMLARTNLHKKVTRGKMSKADITEDVVKRLSDNNFDRIIGGQL